MIISITDITLCILYMTLTYVSIICINISWYIDCFLLQLKLDVIGINITRTSNVILLFQLWVLGFIVICVQIWWVKATVCTVWSILTSAVARLCCMNWAHWKRAHLAVMFCTLWLSCRIETGLSTMVWYSDDVNAMLTSRLSLWGHNLPYLSVREIPAHH